MLTILSSWLVKQNTNQFLKFTNFSLQLRYWNFSCFVSLTPKVEWVQCAPTDIMLRPTKEAVRYQFCFRNFWWPHVCWEKWIDDWDFVFPRFQSDHQWRKRIRSEMFCPRSGPRFALRLKYNFRCYHISGVSNPVCFSSRVDQHFHIMSRNYLPLSARRKLLNTGKLLSNCRVEVLNHFFKIYLFISIRLSNRRLWLVVTCFGFFETVFISHLNLDFHNWRTGSS